LLPRPALPGFIPCSLYPRKATRPYIFEAGACARAANSQAGISASPRAWRRLPAPSHLWYSSRHPDAAGKAEALGINPLAGSLSVRRHMEGIRRMRRHGLEGSCRWETPHVAWWGKGG
jgi:hypothetical protein